MVECNKYEMILDKLKNKSQISIDSNALINLITIKTKPYYIEIVKDIVPLLIEQYTELIKLAPVLEQSIIDDNFKMFELFFKFYVKYSNGDDLSDEIYRNIDSGYFRVYSLLDSSIRNFKKDKRIFKLILNYISKYEKKEILIHNNKLTTEEEIIHRINNNLPLCHFSIPPLLDLLKSSNFSKESIDLIENELGVEISSIVNFASQINHDSIIIDNNLPSRNYQDLVLYHLKTPIRYSSIYIKQYYINNSYHAIIYLIKKLNQITDNSKYQIILKIYKEIQNNISIKLKSLINLVKDNLIDVNSNEREISNQLYFYFDNYYIYYCLKYYKFEILNNHININYNNSLVFSFSVFTFSFQALELCFKDENSFEEFNENSNYIKLVKPNKDLNQMLIFLDLLLSFKHRITENQWYKLFKIFILFHKNKFLKIVLDNTTLQPHYKNLILNRYKDIVCFYIYNKKEKSLEKKLKQFAESILNIPLDQKENYYIDIYTDILDNSNILKKEDYQLILKFLQPHTTNNKRIEYFIKVLFKKSENLDLNLTLSVYNSIDDNYFQNISKYSNSKFYQSKSNILINHFLKLIISKDSYNVIIILSALFKSIIFDENEIKDIFNTNNCFQVIRIFNSKGYFKTFSIKILLNSILDLFNVLDKNLIYELIPDNNIPLKIKMEQKLLNSNNISYYHFTENELLNYLIYGQYNNAYQLILKYKKSPPPYNNINYFTFYFPPLKLISSLIDNSISLEWFIKFYDPIISKIFKDIKIIKVYVYQRIDLFEYIWEKRLSNHDKYIFIIDLFHSLSNNYHQFVEYVLIKKKDFIESFDLSNDQIKVINEKVLLKGNPIIYQIVRSIFNEQFSTTSIDFNIIYQMIKYDKSIDSYNYDMIEHLYRNKLIENFKEIIGEQNFKKLVIKELYNENHPVLTSTNYIVVTKSMFILIHLILKEQNDIKETKIKDIERKIDTRKEGNTENNHNYYLNYVNWFYSLFSTNKE